MKAVARALYRFSRNVIDRPAVILLYHRVTDMALDPQQLAVSPENFDAQLNHLKKKYSLISIPEFSDAIVNNRKLPKRSVAITFDDGYADNYHEAIPALEKYGTQALFYVATANLDTQNEFWWDNLERIFLLDNPLPGKLEINWKGQSRIFSTSSKDERVETYNALHPVLKDCAPNLRDELVNNILSWAGLQQAGRDSHRMMTTSELISLAKSASAVVGAHTHNHPKLSVCSNQEQREEIVMSKEILEQKLNQEITHFSYPFGSKADYTKETVQICKSAGFKIVSSNYYDQVHSWHSPFELPRILVRNWSPEVFESKMKTFFAF